MLVGRRRRLPPPLLMEGTHRMRLTGQEQLRPQLMPMRRRQIKGQLPPARVVTSPLPDLRQCRLPPKHHIQLRLMGVPAEMHSRQ